MIYNHVPLKALSLGVAQVLLVAIWLVPVPAGSGSSLAWPVPGEKPSGGSLGWPGRTLTGFRPAIGLWVSVVQTAHPHEVDGGV